MEEKKKRHRRTKAEMEAYRSQLAQEDILKEKQHKEVVENTGVEMSAPIGYKHTPKTLLEACEHIQFLKEEIKNLRDYIHRLVDEKSDH